MTALSLERIEELREAVRCECINVEDEIDLLSLLDKEAAQLKDAKAGATVGVGPRYDPDCDCDACHRERMAEMTKPSPAPSPGPEDERVEGGYWDNSGTHHPSLGSEDDRALEKIETWRQWLVAHRFFSDPNEHKDIVAYLRSRLTGARVTRGQAKLAFRTFWGRLFAEEPGKNEWEWFWPMLKELGLNVGGDDEK